MTVLPFPGTNDWLTALVAASHPRLAAVLPGVKFDDAVWDTSALSKSTADRTQLAYFTLRGSLDEPLPAVFGSGIKVWVLQSDCTASHANQRVSSARWLWSAIAERLGDDAATLFSWRDLRHADLLRAEQIMIEQKVAPNTRHKTAVTLADLARTMGVLDLAPAITYTPITPRFRDSNNHTLNDPESRGKGVLSVAAQHALADIFFRATAPIDVFYSSQMTLMIATGIRWNESATLPEDPLEDIEVEVPDTTGRLIRVPLTYVRKHKAKSQRAGGSGRKSTEQQPLAEEQAVLAKMAVARLQAFCAESRKIAKRLEASAPVWRWPERNRPEWLSKQDLIRALGVSGDTANTYLVECGEVDTENRLPNQRQIRRVSLEALEAAMTARQDWGALEVVKATAGRAPQRASQSLLCLRINELHSDKRVLPLITSVSMNGLSTWLEGKEGQLSVFERFEAEYGVRCREPDGSLVVVDSHMCRRLFVTNALTGGASLLDVARWQGREHIGDLASYDKRSMAERVEKVKSLLMTGRLKGQVAQGYFQLATDVRDEWLAGQVQAMHVTPLGLCVHDFSATPCLKALNCVDDCEWYLFDPNDQAQRTELVQLQRRNREVLERTQPLVDAGKIAPSWVDHTERTLKNVEKILAHKPDPSKGMFQPFAHGVDRFQPVEPEH
jgi:hypothetical protein